MVFKQVPSGIFRAEISAFQDRGTELRADESEPPASQLPTPDADFLMPLRLLPRFVHSNHDSVSLFLLEFRVLFHTNLFVQQKDPALCAPSSVVWDEVLARILHGTSKRERWKCRRFRAICGLRCRNMETKKTSAGTGIAHQNEKRTEKLISSFPAYCPR